MGRLITNYRVSGIQIYSGVMESLALDSQIMESLLRFERVSIQIDSATGNIVTHSTGGYGKPQWYVLILRSVIDTYPQGYKTSFVGSLVYISLLGTASFGSLAATITLPFDILFLIASR